MPSAIMEGTRRLPCICGTCDDYQRIQEHPRYINYSNPAAYRTVEDKPYERAPMPEGRSLLLELPGEIRNVVYEMVALQSGGEVSSKNGKVMSKSGLVCVNRQVHRDASPLTFKVQELDFSHVAEFFNELSVREIKALPQVDVPSHREIRLFLEMNDESYEKLHKLRSWVVSRGDEQQRGYNVKLRYTVELSHKPDDDDELPEAVQRVFTLLYGMRDHAMLDTEGRTFDEASKVVRALARSVLPMLGEPDGANDSAGE
ncbi:hypothetical protein PRZ48_000202 [Zasmidium cellare]|uniref:Uncharacterized protein n=1 Tax=Zasmidium cellare TaxID=395010 RepID=A0ABR0EZ27_ZASCE|nr:hypothetical protein PRZ48_000202 [Zasmidium cellare]